MNRGDSLQLSSLRDLPPAARIFLGLLGKMRHGHLEVLTPHATALTFGNPHEPPSARLHLHDWRACARILQAGDIGFAECYAAGWADTPDLAALLRLALRNREQMESIVGGGRIGKLWYWLRHLLRPNTRAGSRSNIHAHYDIGNAFYRLWLDAGMTYSSAIFEHPGQPLEQAQDAKYRRILDRLQLKPGARILEIGCGWGGFAHYAATRGMQVHGVTISPAQLDWARRRIREQGLEHRVQLELRDYRDLQGSYDAIVSIEMFEAVGERFWPGYFAALARRLNPGGQALIQSITIDEARFDRYRASSDFIREYIFPGGMLPSHERFTAAALRAGMHLHERFHFGRDYAETLRRWSATFMKQREALTGLGFDERFLKLWQLYFAYCEAGFDEGQTDVVQFLLHKDHRTT